MGNGLARALSLSRHVDRRAAYIAENGGLANEDAACLFVVRKLRWASPTNESECA